MKAVSATVRGSIPVAYFFGVPTHTAFKNAFPLKHCDVSVNCAGAYFLSVDGLHDLLYADLFIGVLFQIFQQDFTLSGFIFRHCITPYLRIVRRLLYIILSFLSICKQFANSVDKKTGDSDKTVACSY